MSLHLDAEQIYRAFAARLREETAERDIRLVGIVRGGAWMAERLARDLGVPAPGGARAVSCSRADCARP
ncbi:MAG: bifunctional pyr operon transcriptional regulator/uracil phosphoribosyltransferase PyrR, partial [Betaproteobacteria bacterium]